MCGFSLFWEEIMQPFFPAFELCLKSCSLNFQPQFQLKIEIYKFRDNNFFW
jgi:hypothetical protein